MMFLDLINESFVNASFAHFTKPNCIPMFSLNLLTMLCGPSKSS